MTFGSDDDAQQAFDNWLIRHKPPKVQADLEVFEVEHLDNFMGDYGRAVDQLYITFDQLVALVDQVNFIDKPSWPEHRAIQFVLIAKNLKSFHSAIDRLAKGSYQDAMTLTRTTYETFLRVVHISLYSDRPWGAVSNDAPKGEPGFNASGLVAETLRIDWSFYSIMSTYAHANRLEVARALHQNQTRIGEPDRFGLVYEDDATLVETVLPILLFVTYLSLRFVREVLIGSARVVDADQLGAADEALKWARFVIAGLPKDRWRQVVDDTDYMFQVLDTADSGGDWKALRRLRPTVPRRPSSSSVDGESRTRPVDVELYRVANERLRYAVERMSWPIWHEKKRTILSDVDLWFSDSLVDSMMLHTRNICAFLLEDRPRPDSNRSSDVVADHYFDAGWSNRPDFVLGASRDDHEEMLDEINRRLAHITSHGLWNKNGGIEDSPWRTSSSGSPRC